MVACGGECPVHLGLAEGLMDHATTALPGASGDAVLTGATLTNVNDLVSIGIR